MSAYHSDIALTPTSLTRDYVMRTVRDLGFTVRYMAEWGEWRLALPLLYYMNVQSLERAEAVARQELQAYYTDDAQEILGSARQWWGELRKFS